MALPEIPAGQPTKATVTRILSPEDWIEKQLRVLRDVGEANYRLKIARPKKDPIEEGIKAEEKYAREVKKAIEAKRRAKALEATNIDEWYAYAQAIGAGRLVEGVTLREKEVHDFVKPWQPILTGHVGEIDKLPTVTDKEREEKMVQNLRGLKALKGTWR